MSLEMKSRPNNLDGPSKQLDRAQKAPICQTTGATGKTDAEQ